MDNSVTIDSSVEEAASEPDYVERMQRSVALLDLSRRCHQATTRVARADAAVAAWPESLAWRHERVEALAAQDTIEMLYAWSLRAVPWADWGLIAQDGP